MRAPGDRRSRVRFEVFGAFWGSFDAGDSVRVHNLTHHGALIESNQPLAVESVQRVCLVLEGQPTLAEARVTHVQHSLTLSGRARYLMGMEFLTTSGDFNEAVDRLISYRAISVTTPTKLA